MKTVTDYVKHDIEHFGSLIDSNNDRKRNNDLTLESIKIMINDYHNNAGQMFLVKGFTVSYSCIELHSNVTNAVGYYISYWEKQNADAMVKFLVDLKNRAAAETINYFKRDTLPRAIQESHGSGLAGQRVSNFTNAWTNGIHINLETMNDFVLASTTMCLMILMNYHGNFADTKDLPQGNVVREILLPFNTKYNQKTQGKTIDVYL